MAAASEPAGEPVGGYSRRPLLAAAAVALVMLAVGSVDFARTTDQVPPVPPPCESLACEEARNDQFDERLDRIFELEDEFGSRAWLYAVIALVTVLGAAAFAFARTPPAARRELFTDLGVGGVAWMVLGTIVQIVGSDSILEMPTKQVFYPGIAVLAVAGVGTLLTRRTRQEPDEGSTEIRVAGLAATATAVVLAVISLSGNGDPCVRDVPGWVDSTNAVASVMAAIAAVLGLVAVARRIWIAGLVMLTVGPAAALLALFTTVCWN